MKRFGTDFSNKKVSTTNPPSIDNESFDILKRTETQFDKDNKYNQIDNIASSNENELLKENYKLAENKTNPPVNSTQNNVSSSLLSPNNDIHKISRSKYKSPFADESSLETEEEKVFSKSRFNLYLYTIIVFYLIALGIGYHTTIYEDNVPQKVNVEQRKEQAFLEKIDEYLGNIQSIHAEVVNLITSYEENNISDTELTNNMKQIKEKIKKNQEEIKELNTIESYEAINTQLIELFNVQNSFNDSVIEYINNSKNEESLKKAQKINLLYEEKYQLFFKNYNNKI